MAAAVVSSSSLPGSLASSPFRAPTQLPRSNAMRKSPPLAFEKTPNDSLAPMLSPPELQTYNPFDTMSPSSMSGAENSVTLFQNVIEKQSTAMQALHTAFAAEREAWACERRALLRRITNLEKLLRAQNGHSPAKSPIVSPEGSLASPQSRALSNSIRLPSIAEDGSLRPLSERRDNAPRSIDIPFIETSEASKENEGLAEYVDAASSALDELSVSPPRSVKDKLSPPPLINRTMAGHTPMKVGHRPPTPPPKDIGLQGIEDTPTRNNTHINALLTKCDDEEEDKALTGPLNMPELPGKPKEHNFTEEMLLKKLEMIASDPQNNKPTIFSVPSPGLAIDENGAAAGLSPQTGVSTNNEGPLAPVATRDQTIQSTMSPNTGIHETLSPANGLQGDNTHLEKFEQGGIRLKKKPSTNFGAPFGQLSGFASMRKLS